MNKPIYVLNGPNLNRLGTREPHIYGTHDARRGRGICAAAAAGSQPLEFRQTNREYELIDWIHEAIDKGAAHHHQSGGLFVHLDRHSRRAEDVPGSDHRTAHLQHPSSRDALPQVLRLARCDRDHRGPGSPGIQSRRPRRDGSRRSPRRRLKTLVNSGLSPDASPRPSPRRRACDKNSQPRRVSRDRRYSGTGRAGPSAWRGKLH